MRTSVSRAGIAHQRLDVIDALGRFGGNHFAAALGDEDVVLDTDADVVQRLWHIVGGTDAAEIYVQATGTQLDATALDFFRLTWDLKDLAEYLNVLRSPHQENEDTVRQCQALRDCAAIREEWAALLV